MNYLYYDNVVSKSASYSSQPSTKLEMDQSDPNGPVNLSPRYLNGGLYSPKMQQFQEVLPSGMEYNSYMMSNGYGLDSQYVPITPTTPPLPYLPRMQSPSFSCLSPQDTQSWQQSTQTNYYASQPYLYHQPQHQEVIEYKPRNYLIASRLTQMSKPYMGLDMDDSRGRAENWSFEETKRFIDILISHQKAFENVRRNQALWSVIANDLTKFGYTRTVEKCKNRWKVLVAKYKKCEEKVRKGYPIPKQQGNPNDGLLTGFEFYEELKILLGGSYTVDKVGNIKRLKKKQKVMLEQSRMVDLNRYQPDPSLLHPSSLNPYLSSLNHHPYS